MLQLEDGKGVVVVIIGDSFVKSICGSETETQQQQQHNVFFLCNVAAIYLLLCFSTSIEVLRKPLLSTLCCFLMADLLASVGNLSIVTKSLELNLFIKLGHIPRVCACLFFKSESKSEAVRVKRLCLYGAATSTSKPTSMLNAKGLPQSDNCLGFARCKATDG